MSFCLLSVPVPPALGQRALGERDGMGEPAGGQGPLHCVPTVRFWFLHASESGNWRKRERWQGLSETTL